MAGKSNIEWCTDTWNPIRGCSRVSAGCQRCYAERQAIRQIGGAYAGLIKRTSHGPAWTGEIRTVPDLLDQPLRWTKPRRVFVNSMSDLFHESVPVEFIDRVFMTMLTARAHTFQVLTKRPARMLAYLTAHDIGMRWLNARQVPPIEGFTELATDRLGRNGLPNVWLGVSVEDQETADERLPLLLQTPAAARFVSYEPALGPVDFEQVRNTALLAEGQTHLNALRGFAWACTGPDYVDTCSVGAGLDWVIVGGESGPKARPCDIAWIRSTVEQCKAAGVACFVKQLGARVSGQIQHPDNEGRGVIAARLSDRKGGDPAEWPEDLRVREFPR